MPAVYWIRRVSDKGAGRQAKHTVTLKTAGVDLDEGFAGSSINGSTVLNVLGVPTIDRIDTVPVVSKVPHVPTPT